MYAVFTLSRWDGELRVRLVRRPGLDGFIVSYRNIHVKWLSNRLQRVNLLFENKEQKLSTKVKWCTSENEKKTLVENFNKLDK